MKNFTLLSFFFCSLNLSYGQEEPIKAKPEFTRFKVGFMVTPEIGYRIVKPDKAYRCLSFCNYYQFYNDDILSRREDTEFARMGISAGLTMNYNISRIVGIEVGVQYASRGYSYIANDPVSEYINNPLYVYGPTPVMQFFPRKLEYIYNFNYLELPLRVVFTSGKKKLKFIASAGAAAGLLLNAQQKTYIKYIDGNESTTIDEITYLRQFTISPQLTLGADYQISRYINLRIEPIARYSVRSLVDSPPYTPVKTYLISGGAMVVCYVAF